jgi:putative glutamine amidotransferase
MRQDPPLIGIPCCLRVGEGGFGYHQVGDKYVDAVVDGAGGLPMLIPAIGARLDIDATLDRLDGLMLTGSPSNVEPRHYGGPPPRPGSDPDPARDSTTLPLIRRALDRGVPLLAVCRGHQELNVALGGTLHQHLYEVDGRFDHRSDKTVPMSERYRERHLVTLTPGGVLAHLLGREALLVNSLHGQAIDVLAPGLAVEAVAEDGTIEAVSVEGARSFALAVQWHPEWRVRESPVSMALFSAFGAACRRRLAQRTDERGAHRSVDERSRELA